MSHTIQIQIHSSCEIEDSGKTHLCKLCVDQGYGRGDTPDFTGVFEPLARVTLYLIDEEGLGSYFGAS